ncbi:hypothetical protein BaRGS_00030995 [Batillaria attramentaria]|uniref:Uncharacterized protein n=1 Tax=Batillaria attramentaria TaxID=370345 RepID=A0ABD0JTA8_9CAEN
MEVTLVALVCVLSVLSVSCQQQPLDERIDSHCHPTYYTVQGCIDHPDGYGCECGPGFHWNTKKCMSSAINSRFEFKVSEPARYTLLLSRAFPKLKEFTVAFWLNVSNPRHPGTVLSYKHGDTLNVMRFQSGPKLTFEIWGQRQETRADLIAHEMIHIAWSWSSVDGRWQLFLNGGRKDDGVLKGKQKIIPAGGEFVLGQSSRPGVTFDTTYALEGDLSHFNIWNFILPPREVLFLASNCTFQYCGNAVQWVEFRAGTRGAIKMRWPSGIFGHEGFPCITEKQAAETCDKSCSSQIGAQCNEQIKENILWSRTPANQNVSVPCPGKKDIDEDEDMENVTLPVAYATRSCLLLPNDNDGVWEEPYIDDCISEELLELKMKFQQLSGGSLDQTHSERPQTIVWKEHGQRYARAEEMYPTLNQTITFCEIMARVVNNLLKPKNEFGWNATRPSGVEGDSLMQVMHRFADVISSSLFYHIVDSQVVWDKANISQFHEYIEMKIVTQWVYKLQAVEFPSEDEVREHGLDRSTGSLRLDTDALQLSNATSSSGPIRVFASISTFKYPTLAKVLPRHDVKSRSLEDWVNSPVMALYLHVKDTTIAGNLTTGVKIHLPMLDTFNISNPACVSLVHRNEKRQWYWTRQYCEVLDYDVRSTLCSCLQPGVFAVTTDMYNDDWDKGDKRPELMNFASYFGCAASATMCLMTCVVHIYLRTSSSTAALHRNLSVSVALSQLVFMFGIDRYDNPLVCQVFAILFHYSFLTTYSWVMNEAFNLYILITYSAHSAGSDLTDSGSMIRYYILGWVIPGVLVGAFVGTADNYYATEMCWVAPDHLWLFLGPACAFIGVTILVLIFTAKEHNENSYTKSDKTNKIISIHMKGLWIQIILITVCWSFAIMSLKILDRIGAFFIVFYLLLHEESYLDRVSVPTVTDVSGD